MGDFLGKSLDADQLYGELVCLTFSRILKLIEALVYILGILGECKLPPGKTRAAFESVLPVTIHLPYGLLRQSILLNIIPNSEVRLTWSSCTRRQVVPFSLHSF